MRKPERTKEAIKLMIENSTKKYLDLVWYARADRKKLMQDEVYKGLAAIQRIEREHPEEVYELGIGDNWQHGFNSGMLAASRLYLSMIEEDVDQALDEFPNLDS